MTSGFFALLDDISTLMDDIALTTKVATQKTVGILGDDLAINAKQASGFVSSREIPVLWAITKGSFINKLILLPFVFLLSAFAPQIITPLLLLGGLYLSFEGTEKIYEYLFLKRKHKKKIESNLIDEKKKIKAAIRTDFILSIEIVIIAIGNVKGYPLIIQVPVVTIIAFLATAGVYGIVTIIVRMDDAGVKLINLSKNRNNILRKTGTFLITLMPVTIKILSFTGTIAMIVVAGGIFFHNITILKNIAVSYPFLVSEFIIGLSIGSVCFALEKLIKIIF